MIGLLAMAAVAAAGHIPPKTYNLYGTAGVCVRWYRSETHASYRRAHHVDAVVVVSSGNPVLDAMLLDQVRSEVPPADAGANGRWVGLNVGVNDDGPPRSPPDCGKLPLTKPSRLGR